ncbi:MAG TPA: helix-turn-helix transcriptional regulator [Streptosporangiaceae bacterium]|nr:helix-turn-helix transcriptional regulator [Streptosporangiaceae bacterium]
MAPRRKTAQELWGNELAHALEAAGMKGRELAEAMHVVPSTVSQWLNGHRKPHRKDVERIEEILGTNGYLGRYLVEWLPREVAHEWLDKWIDVEAQAIQLLSFQPSIVHGLLQTEGYARAVLSNDEQVESRLTRQKILDDDNPPMFVALLDESVLRRKVGDAAIMGEQLTHLAAMAERDNIRLHILPLTADACAEITGPFVIASLDGGDEVAYLDNAITGEVIEGKEQIAKIHRIWELLRSDALPKTESIKLITRMAAEWKT